MTAKKVYWYGVCGVGTDLKVRKIRISKETATRIYLHKEAQTGWNERTLFHNKFGGYENWFPTRKEAVAKKLKWLKNTVKHSVESLKQAEKLLAEFKAQEDV